MATKHPYHPSKGRQKVKLEIIPLHITKKPPKRENLRCKEHVYIYEQH